MFLLRVLFLTSIVFVFGCPTDPKAPQTIPKPSNNKFIDRDAAVPPEVELTRVVFLQTQMLGKSV